METMIRGVPVRFPFEPYQIQKDYMEKVIDCLQRQENGILESPTGTGKTLSLLCSSLAWLEVKKAQIQAQRISLAENTNPDFLSNLQTQLNSAGGKSQTGRAFLGVPTIIYASRTHSQLAQVMSELKRSDYKHMRACVLGSREQMCIHQEVMRETNSSVKLNMCKMKVKTRSCHYFNGVDRKKDDPNVTDVNIVDVEDLVKLGNAHKFCPYFMSKELKQRADIVFMPYNYVLDPKARKALGVEIAGSVIILDEAHNIDKMCEESASLQIKSTDITLCIEEVTTVMKALSNESLQLNDDEIPKDFNAEELCILKEILLKFEKVLDEVPLKNSAPEDTYFEGNYLFQMLEQSGINDQNQSIVINLLDKIIQFLAVASDNDGPFQRRGVGLQLFSDLLTIAFQSINPGFKEKIQQCYKVHITMEEVKRKTADNWLSKATSKAGCRVLSYWCFSPGFGMDMLMNQDVHCVILTSGTLAPLKPLISELGLTVNVRIENPHIVKGDQVCVKILTKGPDNQPLNCNYQNRDNPKYLQSLGCVLMNMIRLIPGGVLIFFPSYPIMQKCQQFWQENGTWSGINNHKPIYVEPRDKNSFNTAMLEYYAKIKDPMYKGAIFMGVCRGKVSEGLDFADINGRAVFITGLPYPPLKDPRVILKKRYLDACHAKDKEFLRGDDWYSLEATRAINQAIGRVIRHKDDYGAIILLDSRFTNPRIQANMSKWLQGHIKVMQNFGELVRELRSFFQTAEKREPQLLKEIKKEEQVENIPPEDLQQPLPTPYRNFNFTPDASPCGSTSSSEDGLVAIHSIKRRKITVVANPTPDTSANTSVKEFLVMVQKALDAASFKEFIKAMASYRENRAIDQLIKSLDAIFLSKPKLRYIIPGIESYIKDSDKNQFSMYCERMK